MEQTYHFKNKERIQKRIKEYYLKNKEKRQQRRKEYYEVNRENILQHDKEYRERSEIRMKRKLRHKDKMINDFHYRLNLRLRARIRLALKVVKTEKHFKTKELIGCSVEQLKEHLEKQFKPGMSWMNYGYRGWHIDHIKPCKAFNLTDPEQQKQCFHYSNLQPLWAQENMSKGSKII